MNKIIDELDNWQLSDQGMSAAKRKLLIETADCLRNMLVVIQKTLEIAGQDGTSCQCQGERCDWCTIRKLCKSVLK